MGILEENLSNSEQDKLDLDYQLQLLDKVKEELGMNQSDIARKFQMSMATVSRWSKQSAKMPFVARLALEMMIREKHYQEMLNSWKNLNRAMDYLKM